MTPVVQYSVCLVLVQSFDPFFYNHIFCKILHFNCVYVPELAGLQVYTFTYRRLFSHLSVQTYPIP